jgi:hypothetical protein
MNYCTFHLQESRGHKGQSEHLILEFQNPQSRSTFQSEHNYLELML